MSYATITRGEFGGDRFTIVANAALRDARLSYKARGLLAFMASHRQGWGVTEKQFATISPEGVASVRSGLKELEAFGYLRRYRTRDRLGRLGAAHWVVTDDPTSLMERVAELNRSMAGKDLVSLQSRRSEPKYGFPELDDPPEDDRTPKKTNHKNTNTQEQGEGEEGARAWARASRPPTETTNHGDPRRWGAAAGERPEPEVGSLFARTIIDGIASETGLGLSPAQHRRLVLEHLPTALAAVGDLADDAIGPTELLEWLRSDHETTMSLYAVLSTRCRPDYLAQALPIRVARNRTLGGLPGPSSPKVPRPRREPGPEADPGPFTRGGAPSTCVLHTGIALLADATGRRTRCHQCESLPEPAPVTLVEEVPTPTAGDVIAVLDEALPDTEPAPPEHCGNRSCHEQRRHIIRFNPVTATHEDLGPCPRCHLDRVREPAA